MLCLLDEIDARPKEKWPYDVCFSKLELNKQPGRQVVVVLLGSTQTSLDAMASEMRLRDKGPDLLSRVLLDQYSFEIPAVTLEDAAVMVVGHVVKVVGDRVRSVEKLALYYILSKESLRSSPRQLSEFVSLAAGRVQADDRRLRFHHLFRPEDEEARYAFRRGNEDLLTSLANVDVQIVG